MNKLKIVVFFLSIILRIEAQVPLKTNIDFIIVVDENIAIGSISNIKLHLFSTKEKKEIPIDYHPGNMSFITADFNEIISSDSISIRLSFNYGEYLQNHEKTYYYDLEIKKEWLQDDFAILKIYNLDKRKYRKKFDPINKDSKYTYELDSPTYTFRRISEK